MVLRPTTFENWTGVDIRDLSGAVDGIQLWLVFLCKSGFLGSCVSLPLVIGPRLFFGVITGIAVGLIGAILAAQKFLQYRPGNRQWPPTMQERS